MLGHKDLGVFDHGVYPYTPKKLKTSVFGDHYREVDWLPIFRTKKLRTTWLELRYWLHPWQQQAGLAPVSKVNPKMSSDQLRVVNHRELFNYIGILGNYIYSYEYVYLSNL